jgi:hypothetical protein
MYREIYDSTQRLFTLLKSAEIEGASEPEVADDGDILLGKAAEMAGAEYPPPPYAAAVVCRVAAEVAEVAGAGEIQMAGNSGI